MMQMKLEVVILPVTDVDQAKAFYHDKIGFNVDHDVSPGNGMRIVQLTPPGSACSIVIGSGMGQDMQPGSIKGLHLVIADAAKARTMLVEAGVDVGEIDDLGQGIKHVGWSDPDGNSWVFQELPWRSGEF